MSYSRPGRRQSRRISVKIITDISLTPLIDVVLTLLLMFMISGPIVHSIFKINLPDVDLTQNDTQSVRSQQEVIIAMDQQGTVFFDGLSIMENQLKDKLNTLNESGGVSKICVRADSGIAYGKVIGLFNIIKSSCVSLPVVLEVQKK